MIRSAGRTLIKYRDFLNTDHPLIIDIWRHQIPCRSRVELMNRQLLDLHVFGKPYFERAGLILAIREDADGTSTPLGFVHAGFGPNEDESDLNFADGIICQLQVIDQDEQGREVARELLNRACEYLRQRGATRVYSGSRFPSAPFYLGMYGGSRIPGIVSEDQSTTKSLIETGFEVDQEITVFEQNLTGFRPPVDRQQMTIRRKLNVTPHADPMENSWWECCTLGLAAREAFTACDRKSNDICAHVLFWDIQPLASEWGVVARGLYGLQVDEDCRRQGIATFLLGESLRHLLQQGVTMVQAQASSADQASMAVFKKLNFTATGTGVVFTKAL